MTKFVGIILKVMNIFIVVIYLSTCFIPELPAGEFWIIAILGLVFPLLLVIVAGFLIGWLIARSKWFMLSLVALVLSWQQVSVVAGLNTKKEFAFSKRNETLRILSWNVSSWGETNRSHAPKINYRVLTTEMIQEQQADVLCFQEFRDKKNPQSNYSYLQAFKEMGYPYSFFVKSGFDNENGMGVVIISKCPITDSAKFTYGVGANAENLIYADILFNQQKIRILTTHLQSVRFQDDEYSTLSKIKNTEKSGIRDSKTIVRKLKNAYRFRGLQADLVQQKIKESPNPVIICGDFNDVPNSYTYFTIKGDLQDAFLQKGTGLGRTFQYISPTLRIDYILADKDFKVTQFNRIKAPYSDHFPVVADLDIIPL